MRGPEINLLIWVPNKFINRQFCVTHTTLAPGECGRDGRNRTKNERVFRVLSQNQKNAKVFEGVGPQDHEIVDNTQGFSRFWAQAANNAEVFKGVWPSGSRNRQISRSPKGHDIQENAQVLCKSGENYILKTFLSPPRPRQAAALMNSSSHCSCAAEYFFKSKYVV